MRSIGRIARGAISLLCVAAAASCSIVDKFSGRAVDYNLEAEQAQEQQLFLNIIRASLRRPMQFTTLQSVTGNASASGSAALTLPFGESGHRPRNVLSADQLLLSGGLQGGPQFTVPVLDTQEFYQGILTPISLQAFDFYIKQGFPPEVLFTLFVASVTVTKADGTAEFTFVNNVADDLQYRQFNLFMEYMIGIGLTTEHIDTSSVFGPKLSETHMQPKDSSEMSRLLDAYAKVATAGLEFKSQPESKDLTLIKKSGGYRFCIARRDKRQDQWLNVASDAPIYCGNYKDKYKSEPVGQPNEAGISKFKVAIPPGILEALDAVKQDQVNLTKDMSPKPDYVETAIDKSLFSGSQVTFKLVTRSTESMLYYLGEVVRRQHNTKPRAPGVFQPRTRVVQIRDWVPYGYIPSSDCDDLKNDGMAEAKHDAEPFLPGINKRDVTYVCEPFFYVAKNIGYSERTALSVEYDGSQYSILKDEHRGGRSLQVLELVKQLWALNTSGKQFPTTNVFSIITPP